MHTFRPIAVLLLLLILAPGARAEEEEQWMRIHINGAHSGYSHSVVDRSGDEVVTSGVSRFEMNRAGAVAVIESSSETRESADGALLSIQAVVKMSASETKARYTFTENEVNIETEVLGTPRSVKLPLSGPVSGPYHIQEATRGLAGTTDEVLTFHTYMADFQSEVDITLTSRGLETVELHDGREVEATRVDTRFTGVPMAPVAWIDADGDAVKTTVTTGGLHIETYVVANEAAAKAEGEEAPVTRPDLFLDTLLSENDPIPVPRRLDEAVVVITMRDAEAEAPDLADAGHQVTPREQGVLEVRARRVVPPEDHGGVRPLAAPPPELADALAPSSMIQSDAPEIQSLASEIVGDETDAWKAAQDIETWVYENLEAKNFNVAFASALEVCRNLEGDCTEHAVLTAALCRAAGIPARVLMGVEFIYGIWGGHAWNDVYVAGSWYPLDATNGMGSVDPLHLPMARMTMKEGGGSEFASVLAGLGTLDLDVTEVVRDGRRIRVQDSADLVTTKDGRYEDRIWGVAFTAPEGFTFDPPPLGKPRIRLMELDGTSPSGATAEIEIDARDAPAGEDWDALFDQMHVDATQAQAGAVDGRPSRRFASADKIRVGVMDDGALYTFKWEGPSTPEDLAVFDAFLKSVDFDVVGTATAPR